MKVQLVAGDYIKFLDENEPATESKSKDGWFRVGCVHAKDGVFFLAKDELGGGAYCREHDTYFGLTTNCKMKIKSGVNIKKLIELI